MNKKDNHKLVNVENSIISFLLGHFRNRSGMYLGRSKISLLSTFMTGHIITLQLNGIDENSDPFFGENGFFEWYADKFKLEASSNWYSTILARDNGIEENAIETFLILLEEFAEEKNITY